MIQVNVLLIGILSMVSTPVFAANTLTVRACEGSNLDIKCENGLIKVISENYGRLSKDICATNGIFGDPCVGTYKYLEVEYECISTQSTLKEEIACEGSTLNIKCDSRSVIEVLRAYYGRLSRTKCNPNGSAQIRTTNCASRNSFRIVNGKCHNQQECSIQASNTIFGDPCRGTSKYLDVIYRCVRRKQPIKNAVACENTNLDIKCESGEQVWIVRANYGRTSSKICNQGGGATSSNTRNENCSSQNSKAIVENYCAGQQRCYIPANNNVFQDPCVGTFKYLEVDYICKRR